MYVVLLKMYKILFTDRWTENQVGDVNVGDWSSFYHLQGRLLVCGRPFPSIFHSRARAHEVPGGETPTPAGQVQCPLSVWTWPQPPGEGQTSVTNPYNLQMRVKPVLQTLTTSRWESNQCYKPLQPPGESQTSVTKSFPSVQTTRSVSVQIIHFSIVPLEQGSRCQCSIGSNGGRVVKLLACGARGPGFDSRPRHLNFQRLVISCFQVEIWLKDR